MESLPNSAAGHLSRSNPALFPDSAEDRGNIGSKFLPGESTNKESVTTSRPGQWRAGATGATGSIPKLHHPTKIILKAQSIRFPSLSSLVRESWWTNMRDRPSTFPWQHNRRSGDRCLFTYEHMIVYLCTSLFTYDTFGVGCTDGGKLLHPAGLCRISPPEEVVYLNGMNVSRSIGVIIAPILVTDAV